MLLVHAIQRVTYCGPFMTISLIPMTATAALELPILKLLTTLSTNDLTLPKSSIERLELSSTSTAMSSRLLCGQAVSQRHCVDRGGQGSASGAQAQGASAARQQQRSNISLTVSLSSVAKKGQVTTIRGATTHEHLRQTRQDLWFAALDAHMSTVRGLLPRGMKLSSPTLK